MADVRRLLEDLALLESLGQGAEIKARLAKVGEDLARIDARAEADEYRRDEELAERVAEQQADASRQAEVGKGDRFRKSADQAFAAGDWARAFERYEVAARTYGAEYKVPDLRIFGRAYARYRGALCARELGDYETALTVFTELRRTPLGISDDADEVRLFADEFDAEFRRTCEAALAKVAESDDGVPELVRTEAESLLVRLAGDAPASLRTSVVLAPVIARYKVLKTKAESLLPILDRHALKAVERRGEIADFLAKLQCAIEAIEIGDRSPDVPDAHGALLIDVSDAIQAELAVEKEALDRAVAELEKRLGPSAGEETVAGAILLFGLLSVPASWVITTLRLWHGATVGGADFYGIGFNGYLTFPVLAFSGASILLTAWTASTEAGGREKRRVLGPEFEEARLRRDQVMAEIELLRAK